MALVLGGMMLRTQPDARVLVWLVYIAGAAAILYQPRWGLYLIVFFALVGDGNIIPWYPFVKNFSSNESAMFLAEALIFSPLELYLILTIISWIGKDILLKRVSYYRGEITVPALIFLTFIIIGFFYGIFRGGDLNIALWEVRPFFYLVAMIILASNLFTKEEHYSHALWFAVIAILIESIMGINYFVTVSGGSIDGLERLTEHSASIHIGSIFVLAIAAWISRGSLAKRTILLSIIPFIAIAFLLAQRRAAFVAFAVALIVFAVYLFLSNRQLFWFIVPAAGIIAILYLGLFWNSSSVIGLPVQAIKSVVAPDSSNVADQSSDLYRQIENINTSFTIHQKPLTGVGFGNKFYVIVPLPDISFFAWWDYFPHNSIIYIWVKAGVAAFCAMLFFIGMTVLTGAKVLGRLKRPESKVILLTAIIYVIMHFIFAYVDISWDTQSMLYLGAAIGIINSGERILIGPAKELN